MEGNDVDLDRMLGINPEDPTDALAERLVDEDEGLLDKLVSLRIKQGLSQEDVGRRLGVTQGAIARIESGERDPHLSTLRRYALALNVEVRHSAELFHRETAEAPALEGWARSAAHYVLATGSDLRADLVSYLDADEDTVNRVWHAAFDSKRQGVTRR